MLQIPSTEQLAYLAGYFDGDGSVFYSKGLISVGIGSGDKAVIERFAILFGGKIHRIVAKQSKRAIYDWRRFGADAQEVLAALFPWLIAKREAAVLGLEFRMWKAGVKLPEDIRQQREEIGQKIHEINCRVTNTAG
jgi:hypothetical protein